MIAKIKSFIRSKNLFQSGGTVLVAVSGGADSVALTLFLNDLKHEFGIKLELAHFNHKIRPESEGEEAFVRAFAARMNLKLTVGSPSKNLKEASGSLEDRARQARLEFLVRTAQDISADRIALAHHRDDLAETVLMKVIRGSGLQGLQAIRPVRTLNGQTFIRPLLCVERREIENFLKDRGQDFCCDASNDNTDFTRNRVRHELIPLLKKDYNPNIVSVLANFSETASDDFECLDGMAKDLMPHMIVDRSERMITLIVMGLKEHPIALQRLIIRRAAGELKGNLNAIEFSHWMEVEDLIDHRPDGSIVDWPAGIRLKKLKGHLEIWSTKT